jgi:hypothetical protein
MDNPWTQIPPDHCGTLPSSRSQEGKDTMSMDMRRLIQYSTGTNAQKITYYMSAECIAGYNEALHKVKNSSDRMF